MLTFEKLFEQYFLSESEVDELIRKGLLSPQIRSPRLARNNDGYLVEKSHSSSYFKSIGVKAVFAETRYDDYHVNGDPSMMGDCFYLTDFYLVYVEFNWSFKRIKNATVYTEPDVVHIIPLELIDECEIAYGRTYNWKDEGFTAEKQKSAVAGAAVGAVIAGPAGAVVGAIANSGKKKVYIPDRYHSNSSFNLNIRIGNDCYSANDWHHVNDLNKSASSCESTNRSQLNRVARELIDRTKKNQSENEKISICKNTVDEGKKKHRKDNIVGYIGIAIFVLIIFLFSSCITSC